MVYLPVIDEEAFTLFDFPQLTGTPERRLLLAVLERAILDYVGNDETEVNAAKEWIFSDLDNPTYEDFTFPWICQHLDLDAAGVARIIRQMPRRGRQRVAPWYFAKGHFLKPSNQEQDKEKVEKIAS